jgi:hypothetical protein
MSFDKLTLLKNYCQLTKEMEQIKNKIVVLRDVTKHIMNDTKSKKDKKRVYVEFEKKLEQIKNDDNEKKRYACLKLEKAKLEEEILNIDIPVNTDFKFELGLINTFEVTGSKNIKRNVNFLITKYTNLVNGGKTRKIVTNPIMDISNNTNRTSRIIRLTENSENIQHIEKIYSLLETLKATN